MATEDGSGGSGDATSREGGGSDTVDVTSPVGAPGVARPVSEAGPPAEPMPSWAPPVVRLAARELFWVLVGSALAVGVISYLAGRLSNVLTILFMALFLS